MHCIHDITPLSLKWHPPYLSHHNDSIDGLRPTLCVTSHPLYGCQLMHSTQRHIHSLWLQAIVVITLHPLHSWHQTPYIWDHTHGNTNIISAILPAISNTTSTVSVSSKQGINYSTTTLCMISHRLYVWHPIQYAWYHNNCLWHHTPLCTTSHPAYLWHHFQYICYHHTAFSLSALWCPLSEPTVLLGFLLPWTWGISAAAPYLEHGVREKQKKKDSIYSSSIF